MFTRRELTYLHRQKELLLKQSGELRRQLECSCTDLNSGVSRLTRMLGLIRPIFSFFKQS